MIWQERTVSIEEVPCRNDWLSAGELDAPLWRRRGHKGSFAARLLTKQILAECDGTIDHYSQIHIESRDGRDRPTRPQAFVRGRLITWNISMSHSDRVASTAVIPASQGHIGIDLVDLEPLSVRPLQYWFTSAEAGRATDGLSMGMIWSLKEAIFKTSNEGTPFRPLRIDTSSVLPFAEWFRIERGLRIHGKAAGSMNNGWKLSLKVVDGTIRTLVWCPTTRR